MKEMDVHDIARRLFEAHGAAALSEAAQKAHACEKAGDQEQAGHWRRVEAAIREMHGPHSS